MLDAAEDGKFDVVISEALDRLSRDQEDMARIYKQLAFLDIPIITLSEGEINEMHIGMSGTMATLYIKGLADKTRRGLQGRALEGKSVGGRTYGYETIRQFNQKGEVISEERRIVPEEAAIVRRIYAEYLAGKSPRKIAMELNAEGVPSPSGKAWGQTSLNGNRRRGTGVLNNELYIGRMVWNRLRYKKDPKTRKRVSRLNPESEWVITELPDMRIIDDESWQAVRRYQSKLNEQPAFNGKKRPPKLLSYLLKCGLCGSGMSIIGTARYGCSCARDKGTCTNKVTIKQAELEERVIGTLRARLMNPELTSVFCKAYTEHLNKVRMAHNAERHLREKELADVRKSIAKVIESIKAGVDPTLIKDEANAMQRRKEELEALLADSEEAPIYIHPKMGDRYTLAVSQLIESLNDPAHRDASAKLLRELIDKIVLTPNEDNSALVVDLYGDLAGILQVSRAVDGKIELKPNRDLNRDEAAEIQQVRDIVEDAENLTGGPSGGNCKVQLVAGARISLVLLPRAGFAALTEQELALRCRFPAVLLQNTYFWQPM